MSALDLAGEPLFICIAGWAGIEGTREQIEQEVSLPLDVEWPDGFHIEFWRDGVFAFSLHRCKPPGAKGHKSQYKDVDWWFLDWTVPRWRGKGF